jgi:hypothetical protein
LALAAVFLLALASNSVAQARLTGADLEGTVRDESGAVLPGATVTAANVATNLMRTVTTDSHGHFVVPALPPGQYRVTAELSGFAKAAREGIELRLGQSIDVDFSLKIAGAQEEITVAAEASIVDVHDTSVSEVVGQQQIDNLPINGRNFISFSVITPGVTVDLTPQQGASATSGLSFAGQRARSNNIMVDGLDNNDPVVGAVRAVFSQEAIREFQVLTNSYSAEFGKASGGVVNIVTKSGTNEFHGNGFFYFRDKSLNAKDHFEEFDVFGNPIDREKAPFSQYQYGATLGGPLKKDKTFFFLSVERLDVGASNLVTISSANAAILNSVGFPVVVGANPYDVEQTQLLAKIDHQWNPDSSLVFRANYSDTLNQNIEPFGGLVAKSRGAEQDRTDYSFSLSQTDILSAKWVNEARVQYARQDQKINALDPNCGGPVDLSTAYRSTCLGDDQGGPTLEVAGVASVGRQRFTPQPRKNDRIQFTETVSYFGGNHQVKAGIDFNWIDFKEQALPLHFGGRYIFGPLPAIPALGIPVPLSAIAAVAAGVPQAYVQGYGESGTDYPYKDLSFFLQDEWRVSRKLTIKPGIRYQKQFWPDVPYDVSTINGARYLYDFPQDNDNIAPRISFAFDPKGDGKTSIHAAYGIFFDNHITGISGITNGIDGSADGVRTLVAAITTSPATVITAWRAPGHRLTEAQALALLGGSYPSLEISIDPGLETPYAHQAAVGFDRAIGQDFAVSANFLYVRGKHQLGTIDYNPVVPTLGPGRRPNDLNGRAGTSASVLQYTSYGETWYRGVTLALNKRFSHGYQFLVSYTYSKAEDNSTDFQSAFIPQSNGTGRNPADVTGLPTGFNPNLEKGPATWDQTHRFVFSGLYQFPWEIQVSTIVTAASGRPFTPLAGVDLNGDGNGGAAPPDRARRVPTDIGSSVGRNSENLPTQLAVDLRLSKRFRIGKSGAVEPIFEVFNLFNRTNYSEVNNIFGTGAFPDNPARDAAGRVTYGTFTQATSPRQMQLALKISF